MIFQNIVNESKLAEDTESDAEEDAHLDVEEPASKDGNTKEILAKSDAAGKSMVPTAAAAITQMASRTSPEKLTPSKVPNSTKLPSSPALPVTLPADLTTIGQCAFNDTEITSLTLPNGLVTVPESAFKGLTELTSVTMPGACVWVCGCVGYVGVCVGVCACAWVCGCVGRNVCAHARTHTHTHTHTRRVVNGH